MCRKSFPSRFLAVSTHNEPLHKLGLPYIGPWTWIRQAHLIGLVRLYFYPLQLPLSPHGSVILEKKDQWGEGSKLMGWRFEGLWVDSSKLMGWRFESLWVNGLKLMGWRFEALWFDGFSADAVNCANIWQVVRKPLWCMTRVILRLDFISDRRVASSSAYTSLINTKVYLSHFFIFNWNILSECNHHPCQRPSHSICYIRRRHTASIQLLHPSSTLFIRSFTKIGKCSLSMSPADILTLFLF